MMCKYLGLPSPALASFVGMRISGTTARVDAYGDALTSALLPLDQFARIRHDPLVRLLGAFLRDFARTYVDVEAFVWALALSLPPSVRTLGRTLLSPLITPDVISAPSCPTCSAT